MKAIWNWLSGRKTIICSILIIILQAGVLTFLTPEWENVLLAIIGALGAGSLIHHETKRAAGEDK